METTSELIQKYLDKADELAENEVIRLATEVLIKNSAVVEEFIMAMGSFFFTSKQDQGYNWSLEYEIKSLIGGEELWDFIIEWDNQLKITGNPIRFSLESRVKRDW